MSLIGLVLLAAGVAELYAVVNDLSTGDLWHALRDHGVTGLVTVVDQQRGKRQANTSAAQTQLASLTTQSSSSSSSSTGAITQTQPGPPSAPGGNNAFPGPLQPGEQVA